MVRDAGDAVSLPVPWASVADALSGSEHWSHVGAPILIERLHSGKDVFRIVLENSGAAPPSFVLKSASVWEAETHVRVASEIEDVVARVYGKIRTPGGLVSLLMEDLDSRQMRCIGIDSDRAEAYGRATEVLATVHNYFDGHWSCLTDPPRIEYGLSGETVHELPVLLNLLVAVLGISLNETVIREVSRIGTHFEEHVRRCASSGSLTLTHGDFHPRNVMYSAAGEVRILDWGEAAVGTPEWDLVMCGEEQLSGYLARRACLDERAFLERLRSAVILRMFRFIHAAIGLVFAESTVPSESFLMSIPLYVARLLEAANSTLFRGGDPLQACTAVCHPQSAPTP
jgi:hypothetical protein